MVVPTVLVFDMAAIEKKLDVDFKKATWVDLNKLTYLSGKLRYAKSLSRWWDMLCTCFLGRVLGAFF